MGPFGSCIGSGTLISGLYQDKYGHDKASFLGAVEAKGLEADVEVYYDNGKWGLRFQKEEGLWKVRALEYSGSNEMLFLQSVRGKYGKKM